MTFRIVMLLGLLSAAASSAAPPNIVVILTDDQGWKDVSYHGAEFATPNIDRLAEEGVELDRFYVTPICSPTRAGLLTGRYPLRSGVQRITVKRWGPRAVNEDEILLPQALAKAGYRTRAMAGKWHLGWSKRAHHPIGRGFTSFYGLGGGAIDFFTHKQFGAVDWHRNWKVLHEEGYATTLLGKEAARIIETSRPGEPFFLYVAFNAIHTPNQALEEHLKRYAHIKNDDRRVKAAMSASLDDEVGRILDALERKGIADDTLVLYLSDNGGAIPSGSVNEPLRGGKWAVYEGGIRVNASIRWPNGLEGGRKLTEPISYIDVFPTLMAVAGVKDHGGHPFDGENVWDVIEGKRKRDDWVFHSYFQGQKIPQNEEPGRKILFERNAVNTPEWKLVRLGPDLRQVNDPKKDAQIELYRIDRDPYEKKNVAAEHPGIVDDFLAKMIKFRALQKKNIHPIGYRPPPGWKPKSYQIPAE